MVLSGIFLLNLYFQKKKKLKEGSSVGGNPWLSETNHPLPGNDGFGRHIFQPLGISPHFLPFDGGPLKNPGDKAVGPINILISVVTAVGSYFLFVKWLNIPMPKGWIGIERRLSYV